VRLFKAAKSAYLFGCIDEARSLQTYGRILLDQGLELAYGPHNFAPFFLTETAVHITTLARMEDCSGSAVTATEAEPSTALPVGAKGCSSS
jgi:hypothetical protein